MRSFVWWKRLGVERNCAIGKEQNIRAARGLEKHQPDLNSICTLIHCLCLCQGTKLVHCIQNRPISIYQNSALNSRPQHESLGNKPHKLCSCSPEPRVEVYCLRLNFNVSKYVYWLGGQHGNTGGRGLSKGSLRYFVILTMQWGLPNLKS